MTGDFVKDFTLRDQSGKEFNLYKNLEDNNNVLLVFYPRDSSLVCTRQLKNYQAEKDLFYRKNIVLAGVNTGDKTSHSYFCEHSNIDFPLLVDEGKEISRRFDALNFLGINKRKLVLIGASKKILFEKNILTVTYLNSKGIFKILTDQNIL